MQRHHGMIRNPALLTLLALSVRDEPAAAEPVPDEPVAPPAGLRGAGAEAVVVDEASHMLPPAPPARIIPTAKKR